MLHTAKLKSNLSDDVNKHVTFFLNNHNIQSLYRLKSKFIFPPITKEFTPSKSWFFNSTSDLVPINAHTAKNDDSFLMHRIIDYLVRPRHHITFIRSIIIFVTAAKILSKSRYSEMFTCTTSYYKFTKKVAVFMGTAKHFSRDCSLKSLCAVFLVLDVLSDVLCVH